MKIWKTQVEGTKKFVWHGDGAVNGRRLRPRNMTTKAEVEAVFSVAKARAVQRKYDLPQERPDVFLSELVAERVKDLDDHNHNRRRIRTFLENFRDFFAGDPRVDELTSRDLLDCCATPAATSPPSRAGRPRPRPTSPSPRAGASG